MVIGRRARFGQLLLFIALVFGIATMHTVGHPAPGHGGGTAEHSMSTSTSSAWTAHAMSVSTAHAKSASTAHAKSASTAHAKSVSTGHIAPPGQQQTADPAGLAHTGPELPGTGMDPMAVCLAVLDTFTLVLLAGGLLRPGPVTALVPCDARILRALWPDPPPRRALLARLSVLRI
ncbi:hypothetical protein OG729_28275 [Streptomyces sp. NBC_00210]|uniref:hypothetical protein n=1 Tax=unclassified Streptomyces TaxID=2593676 RepID=UPI0032527614